MIPLFRASPLRSTALSTVLATGLTLALGLSAFAETDKPAAVQATEKPAAKHAEKPKKTAEKPAAKPATGKPAAKNTADKSTAKHASEKTSDKSFAKGKPPVPNARPVARNVVPKTTPPSPATAPGRESARAPLSPPVAAPAPPARQKVTAPTPARKSGTPAAIAATSSTSKEDLDQLEEVIELVRKHRPDDATQAEAAISDPVARKLAEWLILRSDGNNATVERYRAFLSANPSWPSQTFLRRRLEASLWDDKREDSVGLVVVRERIADFGQGTAGAGEGHAGARRPRQCRAPGARSLAQRSDVGGYRDRGARPVRAFVTGGDQKARMDLFAYTTENEAAAMRAAKRLGAGYVALAKARNASVQKAANTKALLDAVPHELRNDAGYLFAKIQELRREEKYPEAAQLMLSAPRDPARLYNLDEWWIERRLLARKMIDSSEFKTAYLIARDAALPSRDIYKTEQEFTAGWIALRFLNDPATAAQHFARIGVGSVNPTTLARAGYWKGRAAEAMGRDPGGACASTPRPPSNRPAITDSWRAPSSACRSSSSTRCRVRAASSGSKIVRAVQLLFDLDEREIAIPIFADMGENGDADAIIGLGELTARYGYARGMILVGKAALNRGMPFDFYAYPVTGIPSYSPIGPDVEKSVVFAIARQESLFNPGDVSPAQAYGLMQVTPDAGRYVCKRAGVAFDLKRMKTDSAYNAALGAAELGGLLEDFRGSYIMTFAAYNAGRGSLKKWIDRYGDPRDPKVDAVDWVELIPFSETRNYVQRIMENLQVYRARFGGGTRLQIEADLHRGSVE